MLVLDGRPIELEAHLARLATSLRALYGAGLPLTARPLVLERSRRMTHGRLRLTVAPAVPSGPLQAEVQAVEIDPTQVFPPAEDGIGLRSFVVPGGFGAHKWADRALLDGAMAAAPPGELPLLVDTDGTALETVRASVFLAGDGWLATPPADGRILPGITRGQAIEIARAAEIEVREEVLSLSRLHEGEVFLAGSVRGVEPARSLDGVALAAPGEITELVADGLRRRWLRVPPGEGAAAVVGEPRAGRPAG